MQRRALMLAALACMLVVGCFPGTYVSRYPVSGVVKDAVTGAPLPGVSVSYQGEAKLTDAYGAFSFSERKSLTIYAPALEHPMWGRPPSYIGFDKEGYVSRSLPYYATDIVGLELSHLPEEIAALDENIRSAEVTRNSDGQVLVWLVIDHLDKACTFAEFARITRNISEKIVGSELVGKAPDLAFFVGQPWEKGHVWRVYLHLDSDDPDKWGGLEPGQRAWLECSLFSESLLALDERIRYGSFNSTPYGKKCSASFYVAYPEDSSSDSGMKQEAELIAEKVIKALPAGVISDYTHISDETWRMGDRDKPCFWNIRTGWSGKRLATLDWTKTDNATWLNSAEFVSFSRAPCTLFTDFGNRENQSYAPFLKKGVANSHIPNEFHGDKFRY